MDRQIITVPRELMRVMNSSWDIDWRGQSMGETTGGMNRTVFTAFPRWMGAPSLYLRRETILSWRALKLAAQGQVNIYRLSMIDPIGFDFQGAVWGAGIGAEGIPFDEGVTFDEGVGFDFQPTCTAVNGAAAGATQLRVNITPAGIVPRVGQIMGHGDWPFAVVAVSMVSAGVYDLRIQMPLRAAIAAGDMILHEGVGLFEVAEEGGGDLSYEFKHEARPVFRFREVLTR
ncbi:hypothetical protein ACFO5X_10175 [Seohaeicola nanhaiensis]|uniref:Uncharacterized protein n=1 Tax=Seohaeicola nanhaiensis TaxID=1387282 RepID=A0ABV9KFD4_9RHOB